MWPGAAYAGVVRVCLVALLALPLGAAPAAAAEPVQPSAVAAEPVQPSGAAPEPDESSGDPAPDETSSRVPPDVYGKRVDEAEQMLQDWRPGIQIKRLPDSPPPAGANLLYGTALQYSQAEDNPQRAHTSNSSQTIGLHVTGRIPDLVGKTRAEAEQLLWLFGMIGVFQPADGVAAAKVKTQDLTPGTQALWGTTVTAQLGPAPNGATRVRVPNLVGLTVTDARNAAREAGLRLRLRSDSAANTDVVNDQDPAAGRLVAPRTRISVRVTIAGPSLSPSPSPDPSTTAATEADLDQGTPPPSRSVALTTAAISVLVIVFVLLALLVLLLRPRLSARAPKRADWVNAHIHAQAISDVAGAQTTSPSGTTPSLSIRIRSHVEPGRHTLQETSR